MIIYNDTNDNLNNDDEDATATAQLGDLSSILTKAVGIALAPIDPLVFDGNESVGKAISSIKCKINEIIERCNFFTEIMKSYLTNAVSDIVDDADDREDTAFDSYCMDTLTRNDGLVSNSVVAVELGEPCFFSNELMFGVVIPNAFVEANA
jgi:hypothetical protein